MVQCCCYGLTKSAHPDINPLYLVLIFLIEINLHSVYHTMKLHISYPLNFAVLYEQLYFCAWSNYSLL
jgi:hypothetical protein